MVGIVFVVVVCIGDVVMVVVVVVVFVVVVARGAPRNCFFSFFLPFFFFLPFPLWGLRAPSLGPPGPPKGPGPLTQSRLSLPEYGPGLCYQRVTGSVSRWSRD